MREAAFVVAGLLATVAFVAAPADSQFLGNSCTVENFWGVCQFLCRPGNSVILSVDGEGSDLVSVTANCGGTLTVACAATGACSHEAEGPVGYPGVCVVVGWDFDTRGTCSATLL